MSELVIIVYAVEQRAAEVLAGLRRRRLDELPGLEDAASVARDSSGRLTLHMHEQISVEDMQRGQFWRGLTAALFEHESTEMSYVDAAGQQFGDIGIDETYMKQVRSNLQPGSSALLMLVRDVTGDKVLPELESSGSVVLGTTLAPELEAQLRSTVAPQSGAP